MAKTIGYFEDFETEERKNEVYSEGPFVVVDAAGSGFRIEVGVKEHKCPALPDISIYKYALSWRRDMHKKYDPIVMVELCDWLNAKVKNGDIVLAGKVWVSPKHLV